MTTKINHKLTKTTKTNQNLKNETENLKPQLTNNQKLTKTYAYTKQHNGKTHIPNTLLAFAYKCPAEREL